MGDARRLHHQIQSNVFQQTQQQASGKKPKMFQVKIDNIDFRRIARLLDAATVFSRKTSTRLELLRRGGQIPAVLKMEAEEKARRSAYQSLLRRERKKASATTITKRLGDEDGDQHDDEEEAETMDVVNEDMGHLGVKVCIWKQTQQIPDLTNSTGHRKAAGWT
jgi:hypothetical protein